MSSPIDKFLKAAIVSLEAKNQRELCDKLGLKSARVSQWKARGCIPVDIRKTIEKASGIRYEDFIEESMQYEHLELLKKHVAALEEIIATQKAEIERLNILIKNLQGPPKSSS